MKIYIFVDCVFSQPLLPWLHKSGGDGLIKSNGWLLDEIKLALNIKVRNQYDSFVALHVQKIPLPEMQPYRALMSENSTATKTVAVFFCCCCSASRMRHCKMWQEKTEATAAGFQDCPRETKIHRGCCLLLWVELLLPSRQEGSFEGLKMPY